MNSKKMIKRMLPVAIALLVLLVVAISCALIPNKENRTELSSKYKGGTYLELGNTKIDNDAAYELFIRGFGDDAVSELVNVYLLKNTKTVKDQNTSYYDAAKADVEGVDKLITDAIFPKGREQDNLEDGYTAEELQEAIDNDSKAVKDWYESQLSATNGSSLEDLRNVYVIKLAMKNLTLDYLMDKAIYDGVISTLSAIDTFAESVLDYADDELGLADSAMYEVEKNLYEICNSAKEELCNLVNASFSYSKVKSSYKRGKFQVILNSSVAHKDMFVEGTDKWNVKEDAATVDNKYEAFLESCFQLLKSNGATFADKDAMTSNSHFPQATEANESKYNAEFKNTHYFINISFNVASERNNALAQLGVGIFGYKLVHYDAYYEVYNAKYAEQSEETEGMSDADKKTWAQTKALATDGVLLTRDEVLQLFVDLYNNYNSTYSFDGENLVLEKKAIASVEDIERLVGWLSDTQGVNAKDGSNFNLDMLLDENSEYYAYKDLYDFYSQFCFTATDLNNVNSTVKTIVSSVLLDKTLARYDAAVLTTEDTTDDINLETVYSPTSSAYDLYLVLNLGFTKANAFGNSWSDLTAEEKLAKNLEYLEADVKSNYSTTTENSTFAAYRKSKGLVIYDDIVENQYIESHSDFEKSKKSNKLVLCAIDGKEFTTDEAFEFFASTKGLTTIMALYDEYYFLNSDYSRLSEVQKSNGKWDTKSDLYDEIITTRLDDVTNTYDYYNYYYAMYGYETMTWEEFLTNVYYYYGIKTTDDLKLYFVYQDAEEQYKKQFSELGKFVDGAFNYDGLKKYDVSGKYSDNGEYSLWEVLYTNGTENSVFAFDQIDDEYFGISGFHMLISLSDAKGNKIDAAKWSDVQVKYAQELYAKLIAMTDSWEPEKWETEWKSFASTYNTTCPVYNIKDVVEGGDITTGAPTFGGATQAADLQADDYEYAVYKSLGFELTCENLGSITSSSASNYDEGFIDGIKAVYNNIVEVEGVPTAQTDLHAFNEGYITGGFGYHIYVATACTLADPYSLTVKTGSGDSETKSIKLDYSYEGLTKELVIYLTRKANDGESVQIDDTLVALMAEHEIADVFANWYDDSYSYDGVFKELVDTVRGLSKGTLSVISEADNAKNNSYYTTAHRNSGDKDAVKYAQKEYLFDLLTTYYNAMISHYYTPVYDEVNGTSSNTGIEYLIICKNFEDDLNANPNAFKVDGIVKTINLVETDDCKFPVLHLDDEDVVLSFDLYNDCKTYDFLMRYTINGVLEDFKYIKDFATGCVYPDR